MEVKSSAADAPPRTATRSRNIRFTEGVCAQAKARAALEYTTASARITQLLAAWLDGQLPLPPVVATDWDRGPRQPHNTRLPDDLWERGKAKAHEEGTTVSAVIVRLVAASLGNDNVSQGNR